MELGLSSDMRASESDFLSDLGEHVREIRTRKSLSRKALAQMSGLSERYIAQLEAGKGNMSVILLRRICAAMETEIEELFIPKRLREWSDFRRLLQGSESQGVEAAHRILIRYQKNAAPKSTIRRVALVGMRGAGKSTLAHMAAERLQWPFVELNHEIERDHSLQIAEIFPLYGQDGYRRLEQASLRALINREGPMMLATNGGLVSEPETMQLLLENFYTVWIKATPDEQLERVRSQGKMRSTAGDNVALDELRAILKSREADYARANGVVDTSGRTLEQSLDDLLIEIGQKGQSAATRLLAQVG